MSCHSYVFFEKAGEKFCLLMRAGKDFRGCHGQINLCILRKEIIVDKSIKDNNERVRDADRIIALALIEHLFNEGKISELVYRNIKKDTIKKVSVANRELI